MHKFNEHHPEFQGFSEYYDHQILPHLLFAENGRKQNQQSATRFGILAVIAGIIIGIFLYSSYGNMRTLIIPFGISFLLAFGNWQRKMSGVKHETKIHLVSHICKFIAWEFNAKTKAPDYLQRLIYNGLLPSNFDRSLYEDRISGVAHGANFEMLEAHLERKDVNHDGVRWVTVFRGQLMSIKLSTPFMGRTVVLRDKGIFNRSKKSGMKRVGLVDPVFEKIFEAYGTDQVEARYLLTPTFMQRLVDLEKSINGKHIRFAFLEGYLFIVIDTENRFEAGSMRTKLMAPERTQKILDEIGAVYDVIDGVSKPLSS